MQLFHKIRDSFTEAFKHLAEGFSRAMWSLRKLRQSFVRIHLTHSLAFCLAVIVGIRERREIYTMIWCREPLTPFQGLILSATVLTFGAAAWEFLGNKLTTSAQEIRFQQGTDELLKELRDLWGV